MQLAGLTDGPIGSRTVVVTALDAFGNVATTYRGKVEFSSTDPASNVPADYTFTASDLGTHTFVAGFHFSTVGVWSVTALDNTAGIGVSPEISIT